MNSRTSPDLSRAHAALPWSRRDVLRVGALSAFGATLVDWFAARSAQGAVSSQPPAKARQCILIWLDGGPSHLETFDPKPHAPLEVRGPFGTISTRLPGVALSEHLPRIAEQLDRVAIVRSLTSPLGEHNFGTQYMLTGYKPTAALEYPTLGAVVAHHHEELADLPPNVAVPDFRVGGGRFRAAGYLADATAPFAVGGDPGKPDFRVRDLDRFPGLDSTRLDRRREYLAALENFARLDDAQPASEGPFEQAYRLIQSPAAQAAFRLEDEPDAVRNRYGRRSVRQSCLLARRLVERGVPFVTVNNRGWDTHDDLVTRLRDGYTGAQTPVGLIPSLDQAVAALIGDLADRGLLDDVLVLVLGEFGRTPKLNTSAGRDHWPRVFSGLLAGGGVPGGQVIGSSDNVGESPHDRPVTPADLACSVYTLLGLDPRATLHTPDGRPVQLNRDGQPLAELCGT